MYGCARRTVVHRNQTKRRAALKTRTPMKRESDTSVSLVTRLRAEWLENRGSIPGGDAVMFLCHPLQISHGAHPALCPVDIKGSYCESKVAGA
jgi:hypothetical protein